MKNKLIGLSLAGALALATFGLIKPSAEASIEEGLREDNYYYENHHMDSDYYRHHRNMNNDMPRGYGHHRRKMSERSYRPCCDVDFDLNER